MFKLNFYGSFAFLFRGHSIFNPNPSPKDDRFSNRRGGRGGASDFFFKEAHKILTLRTNFSKVPTCKERTRRISFFKERRQKFEASISSHPSGSGGCPVRIKYGLSPRAIFPTPISHSITLSQNLTNWCDLYWRKIIVSTMIS